MPDAPTKYNTEDSYWLEDPERLIVSALRVDRCGEILAMFYTAWTVIWPTEEKLRKARVLLGLMERYGLSDFVRAARENAEKARQAIEASPGLKEAIAGARREEAD
jgi:hypothetical protein